MDNEAYYLLSLLETKGLGLYTLKRLLGHFSSAKSIFDNAKQSPKALVGLQPELLKQIQQGGAPKQAESILEQCQKENIQVLCYHEENYPFLLKQLYLPPLVLYVQGDATLLSRRPSVAFVGTRKTSAYGERHLRHFCKQLAPSKALLIGGWGQGIERMTTQEALRLDMPLVITYPAGLKHPYPQQIPAVLLEEARAKACLVSECPPNQRLQKHGFIARNRIVVGLSEHVVLIESSLKGGAMAMAKIAQAENRDFYALPGDIDRMQSQGPNLLIQRKFALPLHAIDALPEELGITGNEPVSVTETPTNTSLETQDLDEEKKKLLALFPEDRKLLSIEVLANQLPHIDVSKLSVLLFELECLGLVEQNAGNLYRLR